MTLERRVNLTALIFAVAIFLFLFFGAVFGADYYVNTDTGSADGDGSVGKPWVSQRQAADQIGQIAVDPNTSILAESTTIHCDGKKPDVAHVSYDAVQTAVDKTLTVSCSKDYVLQGEGRWALVIKTSFLKYTGGKIVGPAKGGTVCVGHAGITADSTVELDSVSIEKPTAGATDVFASPKTLQKCTPVKTKLTVTTAKEIEP